MKPPLSRKEVFAIQDARRDIAALQAEIVRIENSIPRRVLLTCNADFRSAFAGLCAATCMLNDAVKEAHQ